MKHEAYAIFATPKDGWKETMAMARTWADAQERIRRFDERGYDRIRVIHPDGKKERIIWN